MTRGIQGPEGSQGSIGYTYLTNVGNKGFVSFTNPLVPAAVTIFNGAIYLDQPSSYYVIPFSPSILGSSYQPSEIPSNPGTWFISTIFSAVVPVNYSPDFPAQNPFDLSQLPVTLFFQNVGGVPISLIFGNNDSRTNVTYFSFGTGPSATPSTYLVPPLGILVIETIFTSFNVIRFYNSFLDSLNPNRYYRIADRASKIGYFSAAPSGPRKLTSLNTLTITSDYTFSVADATNHFSQNVIKTQGNLTLTIDGTDAPPLGETLILVQPSEPINLSLVNLVNSRNYQGKFIPSVLDPVDQFFVITGNRIVLYDSGSGAAYSTISAKTSQVLGLSINFETPTSNSVPLQQDTNYVTSFSYTSSGFTFTVAPGSYNLTGVLTAYNPAQSTTTFTYELSPASATTSSSTQNFTFSSSEQSIAPFWEITASTPVIITVSSTGDSDANGDFTLDLVS